MEFTQNERKMVEKVLPEAFEDLDMNPTEKSIRNILDYSKAFSARKSEKIIAYRMVLN